jgi:hypothetical protein
MTSRALIALSGMLLMLIANAVMAQTEPGQNYSYQIPNSTLNAHEFIISVLPLQNYTYSADVGRPVTIGFNLSGGKPPYTYTWQEEGPGQSSYSPISSCYSDSLTCNFTPTTTGFYGVYVTVKDANGNTGIGGVQVYANIALSANLTSQSSTVALGNSTYFELVPVNGSTPYGYYWTFTSTQHGCRGPSPESFGNNPIIAFSPNVSELGCTFTVVGRITDSAGETATNQTNIYVLEYGASENTTVTTTTTGTGNYTGTGTQTNSTTVTNTTPPSPPAIVTSANTSTTQGVNIENFGNGDTEVVTVGTLNFYVVYQNSSASGATVLIDGFPYELHEGASVPLNVSYSGYFVKLDSVVSSGQGNVTSLTLYENLAQNQTAPAVASTSGPGLLEYIEYAVIALIVIGVIVLLLRMRQGRSVAQSQKGAK